MSFAPLSAIRNLSICAMAFALSACDINDGAKVVSVSKADMDKAEARAATLNNNFRTKEHAALLAQSIDGKGAVFYNRGLAIIYSEPVGINPAQVVVDRKCTEYDKTPEKKCVVFEEYTTVLEPNFNVASKMVAGAEIGVVCDNAMTLGSLIVDKNQGKFTGILPQSCSAFSAKSVKDPNSYRLLAAKMAQKELSTLDSKDWYLSMP